MKSNQPGWTPTVTLAKLFEEQDQFFDALAAYELIAQHDSSPAIRERIEALHYRILSDPANRYDPRIEKLFSPEELAYLKIINHQGFDNMSRAMEKLSEGIQGSELIFEEDDILAEETELDNLSQILLEIEQQAQLNLMAGSEELTDFSVGDLLIAILSRYDKNQALKDVSLSDLMGIFIDMQSLKIPKPE